MSAWLPHFDYKERHYFLGQEKTLLKLFQKLSFKVFRERSGRQKEIMIFKRAVSTLIPPKVVSSKNIGSAPNAKRIANVVHFYKSLPQGPAPAIKANTRLARYKAKYFDGDNASGKPLWHFAIGIIAFGYSMEYYFHLRHHKGAEEH